MSDSDNTFKSLLPNMKNAYAEKIKKLTEKPNSTKKYFAFLKKKLKGK